MRASLSSAVVLAVFRGALLAELGLSPLLAGPLVALGRGMVLGSLRVMKVSLAEGLTAPAELTGLIRITVVGELRGSAVSSRNSRACAAEGRSEGRHGQGQGMHSSQPST